MPDARFPRRSRILSKGDFQRVFKNPKRGSDKYFTVLSCENTLGRARLGLAISRKVDKRAVGRNRIKRVLREAFRNLSPNLSHVDLVVIAKPLAARTDNPNLSQSIARLWRRFQSGDSV